MMFLEQHITLAFFQKNLFHVVDIFVFPSGRKRSYSSVVITGVEYLWKDG